MARWYLAGTRTASGVAIVSGGRADVGEDDSAHLRSGGIEPTAPTRCDITGASDPASVLVKYDFASGTAVTHEFGAGCAPAEGVFVPATGAAAEDDGVLLALHLVILDARSFASRPLAKIRLPQRVPFGFHGDWIPDAPR